MRALSTFLIITGLGMAVFSPTFAQQSGGIRIMEPAAEGVCKDEPAPADAARKYVRRQEELARELMVMLKRTAELQEKVAAGAGKDVQAELSRMIERTGKMAAELQTMAGGTKAP